MRRWFVAALFAFAIFSESALSTTFFVTTTADDGAGSLRVAIQDANASPGLDNINFSIAGGGVQTIAPLSPLPAITEPVILDAYTQPGSQANSQAVGNNAAILIDLDGSNAGATANGLHITGGGCTIRGLVIRNFEGAGILLETGGGNVIAGNFIGTNNTGTVAQPNRNGIRLSDSALNLIGGADVGARNLILGSFPNPAIEQPTQFGGLNLIRGNYIGTNAAGTQLLGTGGIVLQSSSNQIGGFTVAERNVLSVAEFGIELRGSAGNVIIGNYIGVSADGTARLVDSASGVGVAIRGAAENRVGGNDASDGVEDGVVNARNVIVGAFACVLIEGAEAFENTVQGNFIGTNATGGPLPSDGFILIAVSISGNASDNLIGGGEAGAGNLIASSSTGSGVRIAAASRNRIQGNFIGTDAAGAQNLGNGTGIWLEGDASNTSIGGPGEAGNVIGRSVEAILIEASGNTVQGNFIGVTRTGAMARNSGGIRISNGSANVIGGTMGEGNRIHGNGSDGVRVQGAGVGNAILGNSIFGNDGLAIDIGEPDLTPNDPGDADSGANDQQNHPVFTAVSFSGGNVTITGTLNSRPNSVYRLEFFSTRVAVAGRSHGESFLGSQSVTTDASGNASFTFTSTGAPGTVIFSATATDGNGNTSEFGGLADRLQNISTRMPVQTGDNVLIAGFIITGSANKQLLLRGIGPSLTPFFGSAAMQDPTLELYQGNTLLMANNNWRDDQEAAIIATGIPPTDNAEAAIVRNLAPGTYTAVLRGNDNTTGIAVVEAYDLERGTDSLLANISTRGFVQTGDNVLIGGFIIGGESGRGTRVIVRAIGPSLTAVGVPNALQDPVLELVDSSGTVVASNDNWRDTQEAEIQASGIPPSHERESAIIVTLRSQDYTAIVRGKDGTIGIAVVEAYNLQ